MVWVFVIFIPLILPCWIVFLANLDMLFSKIFKTKYFSNGDFVTVEEGSNPSFVWKSVLQSYHLIKQGIRWRVGDGNSIRI